MLEEIQVQLTLNDSVMHGMRTSRFRIRKVSPDRGG
ncbi:hypothetical protein CSX04_08143 [Burkholderia cepacia]|nr:hypothetical protein CSX04_08143 [Burkholderia cepacia]